MIFLLLALQAASGPAMPDTDARYRSCIALARTNPVKGMLKATEWRLAGGGVLAQQCLATAYANQARWPEAAAAFELAAHDADTAKDMRADTFWAQAGNAWLAAGDAAKARKALDAALKPGRLAATSLGEALLDRAQALVTLGDTAAARADLDQATGLAPTEPLGWLLSATLARRTGDLPRAKTDIAKAAKLAPTDAAVQLEAGNIAALDHDEAGAKTAWRLAAQLAPDTPQAKAASAALAQFDAPQ